MVSTIAQGGTCKLCFPAVTLPYSFRSLTIASLIVAMGGLGLQTRGGRDGWRGSSDAGAGFGRSGWWALVMMDAYFEIPFRVWRESLVGSGVILAGVGVGWRLGASRGSWFVRVVSWWLDRVVGPLIASKSWLGRASIIAANNTTVCAGLVACGALGHVAWLGAACVGLALGSALRIMSSNLHPSQDRSHGDSVPLETRLLESVGLLLNLLEVPAIMLAAGLSLAQGAMSLAAVPLNVMSTFGQVVLPLLVLSAAGEAMWMGVNPDLPSIWARRQ